jgi:hypothetical protein
MIYTDPGLTALRDAGVQATWYVLPEVSGTLKVSVSIQSDNDDNEVGNPGPATLNPEKFVKPVRLLLTPYNATYKNTFDYDFEGTSELSFKITTIPPPEAANYTKVPDIIEKNIEEAKEAIANSKLVVGDITEQVSDKPEGTVIDQIPKAELNAVIGSSVNIIVSKQE